MQAREEERRALRRVLHDDVAPSVAGISLQAETVRQLLARTSPDGSAATVDPAVESMLDRIDHEAQHASRALRGLAYDLRPPALDERGLIAAIRDYAVRLAPTHVELDVSGLDDRAAVLPAAVEVAAYRIITGAMSNVAQHAAAEHCWIRLKGTPGELVGEVADDGSGLAEEARPGVGILSMRERAVELGGTVTIAPRTGGGTVVTVRLPIGGADG